MPELTLIEIHDLVKRFDDKMADDTYLTWTQQGVTYLLEAHNLSLNLEDLQQIAMS
jgi:hypothetical protein